MLRQSYMTHMTAGPCDSASKPVGGTLNETSGLFELHGADGKPIVRDGTTGIPSLQDFARDYEELISIVSDGRCKTLSHMRIALLEKSFLMHIELNASAESNLETQTKCDFYRTRKVDTHVHLAAAVASQDVLSYIKNKVKTCSDEVVLGGKTLGEVYASIGVPIEHLTVDTIDVEADHTLFDRFDHFNAKYNPCGNSVLRTVFLKSENAIDGKYFAEISRIALNRLETRHHVYYAEYRVSIYGESPSGWAKLAKWVMGNNLKSEHNQWVIQVPRIYRIFRQIGAVSSFQDTISNIFQPIFDATEKPEDHPELAEFLTLVSGFDSVDDESIADLPLAPNGEVTNPAAWTAKQNPPYSYQLYFLYANICRINELRRSKGLNTFALRPHCGESGSVDHLAAAYLTSYGINHGVQLENQITLQYLYYLDKIGLAVSPVSNNVLFLRFDRQPFHKLFMRGLNVSLSTDDPMIFHLSEDPLMEEYAIARQIWQLSTTDMCEIARYSVLQSGYSRQKKAAVDWRCECFRRR